MYAENTENFSNPDNFYDSFYVLRFYRFVLLRDSGVLRQNSSDKKFSAFEKDIPPLQRFDGVAGELQ